MADCYLYIRLISSPSTDILVSLVSTSQYFIVSSTCGTEEGILCHELWDKYTSVRSTYEDDPGSNVTNLCLQNVVRDPPDTKYYVLVSVILASGKQAAA
jgi:hypothetical protein